MVLPYDEGFELIRVAVEARMEEERRQLWLQGGFAQQESYASFKLRLESNIKAARESKEEIMAKVRNLF